MYVYLYDNFLRHKRFAADIKTMEIRLTDYGIAGKILRINNYTDAKPIIEDEVKRGAKTVVIVGNDDSFGQILSRAATVPITFGFLPVGPNNSIAEILGITPGTLAVDVLSRRRRQLLDIGWANNWCFIGQLRIPPAKVEVTYDERFTVRAKDLLEVVVCNLKPYVFKSGQPSDPEKIVHPQDGKLEAFLRPLTKRRWWGYMGEEPSVFPFEEMVIRGEKPFMVEADGKVSKEIKLTIRLAHHKIDLIVGRERQF